MSPRYEYGIAFRRLSPQSHREGLTEDEAIEWLEDWEREGGSPTTFVMIRRVVSGWESVGDAE